MPNNIYKIQNSIKSQSVYILANNIIEAIEIWKTSLKSKKDPELVEWVADYYFTKSN